MIWIVVWLAYYRPPAEDPRLSPAEFRYIASNPREKTVRIPWPHLLGLRQTWVFVLGKFLTDPVWWFFLFWLPKFFSSTHGVTLLGLGLPLIVIYNSATLF